jgi:hypothetical protein
LASNSSAEASKPALGNRETSPVRGSDGVAGWDLLWLLELLHPLTTMTARINAIHIYHRLFFCFMVLSLSFMFISNHDFPV